MQKKKKTFTPIKPKHRTLTEIKQTEEGLFFLYLQCARALAHPQTYQKSKKKHSYISIAQLI